MHFFEFIPVVFDQIFPRDHGGIGRYASFGHQNPPFPGDKVSDL